MLVTYSFYYKIYKAGLLSNLLTTKKFKITTDTVIASEQKAIKAIYTIESDRNI